MKTDKENKKDYISMTLCMIVGFSMIALLAYHTLTAKAEQPNILIEETIAPFELANAGNIQLDEFEGGYEFTYYVDSIESCINVFTSIIEGDYLRVYLDCLELYSYNNSYEDIDDLQSYLLNNSRLKYIDNQWYQGWIWIYDACPTYRFPHP